MGAATTATDLRTLIEGPHVHRNLSTPQLVETAIARGEGRLAANGSLVALTGARTGRSPKTSSSSKTMRRATAWTGAK